MTWTADKLLELGRGYQPAAILAAAADLDLFDAFKGRPRTAPDLARRLACDARALTILLDALVAIDLLEKSNNSYRLSPGTSRFLTATAPDSVLTMAQHQANCLRLWAQLAQVIKDGHPAPKSPSVRGRSGDAAAFIGAMHNVSAPIADRVVRSVRPLQFQSLLDIGGASGTWTIAFLRAYPDGKATLFDLPHVIPMARRRLAAAGLGRRVKLVSGDFMASSLPGGADLAWLSAIVHQNSRAQNRALFANLFQALVPNGRLAIRDILMEPGRTQPLAGALFALNMLAATEGGGTFTFDELRDDLESAGFTKVARVRSDPGMNSVVVAHKIQDR